jgi:hypothetical protein
MAGSRFVPSDTVKNVPGVGVPPASVALVSEERSVAPNARAVKPNSCVVKPNNKRLSLLGSRLSLELYKPDVNYRLLEGMACQMAKTT